MRPPRLAGLLMRLRLPSHLREAIAGDLEEECVASEGEAIWDTTRTNASSHLAERIGEVLEIRSTGLRTDIRVEGDQR